jgi:hypothetical protein
METTTTAISASLNATELPGTSVSPTVTNGGIFIFGLLCVLAIAIVLLVSAYRNRMTRAQGVSPAEGSSRRLASGGIWVIAIFGFLLGLDLAAFAMTNWFFAPGKNVS